MEVGPAGRFRTFASRNCIHSCAGSTGACSRACGTAPGGGCVAAGTRSPVRGRSPSPISGGRRVSRADWRCKSSVAGKCHTAICGSLEGESLPATRPDGAGYSLVATSPNPSESKEVLVYGPITTKTEPGGFDVVRPRFARPVTPNPQPHRAVDPRPQAVGARWRRLAPGVEE